ncbi:hypothetical protein SPRA44_770004 [Serratia proteamaculans]|nr:hypothetical protein SPRA44_770004 [Serratia proteamaculans]
MLTQSWTNWRTWVSHTGCNLQFNVGLYFLGHLQFLGLGNNASQEAPRVSPRSMSKAYKNKRREIIVQFRASDKRQKPLIAD